MSSLSRKTAEQKHPARQEIARRCRNMLGRRFVLDTPEETAVYDCDACILVKGVPDIIVLPNTTEQVAQIIRWCRELSIPYTARGGGTGLSGGAVPIEGGVIIGLNRMNRILEIDTEHRTATVEAGVINAWLNREIEPYGLHYAPDPSSQSACTIGGNIAENAGGIHCIKYGVTTDHVLAVEAVLPDGSIIRPGGKTRRTHGLNLVGLLTGSEGTLGIVTQATVRLTPKPSAIRVYLAAFDGVSDATQTVSDIIANGMLPSALEFIDAFTIGAVNAAFQIGFPETSQAVLLIELDGSHLQLSQEEPRLLAILNRHHAKEIRTAETPEERQRLWAARKGAVAAYGRLFPAFYLHDCVIPRSELTYVLEQIQEIGTRYNLTIGNVFHAGDGNLHPNILFDPENIELLDRVMAGGEDILKLCLSVGGTLSGEHGIGLEKSEYMSLLFRDADLDKMKRIKSLFDPWRLANPSKIFPTGRGCGEINSKTAQRLAKTSEGGGLWI